MKSRLFIALALLASLVVPVHAKKPGPHSPIEEARNSLEHAHSLLTKKEEGAGGKKARIPNIINALDNAETRLAEAKNNKGTHTNDALKYIAQAKTELEAAKTGGAEHLAAAETALDEAMKRVMLGIRVNQ
jgi:hypothetical protein